MNVSSSIGFSGIRFSSKGILGERVNSSYYSWIDIFRLALCPRRRHRASLWLQSEPDKMSVQWKRQWNAFDWNALNALRPPMRVVNWKFKAVSLHKFTLSCRCCTLSVPLAVSLLFEGTIRWHSYGCIAAKKKEHHLPWTATSGKVFPFSFPLLFNARNSNGFTFPSYSASQPILHFINWKCNFNDQSCLLFISHYINEINKWNQHERCFFIRRFVRFLLSIQRPMTDASEKRPNV